MPAFLTEEPAAPVEETHDASAEVAVEAQADDFADDSQADAADDAGTEVALAEAEHDMADLSADADAVGMTALLDEDAVLADADAELPADTDEVDVARVMAEAIEDWGQDDEATPAAEPEAASEPEFDDTDLMESLAAALAEPADQIAPDVEPETGVADDAMLAALIDDADEAAPQAPTVDAEADDAAFEAALMAATASYAPDLEVSDVDALIEDEPADLPEDDADAAEAAFSGAAVQTEETQPEIAAEIPAAPAEASPAVEADAPAAIETVAAEAPAAELAEAPDASTKLQRARARVIKIRRAEPQPPVSTLAPEAEADLARELDALKDEVPARPHLPEVAAENAVQRLIDQTNTQLGGAENRRRHAAIEHLKAAVAATAADRLATGGADDSGEETRLNAYRSDLERVVRPRRPVPAETREVTAVPLRPAPLVLVSAQRIDRPAQAAPAHPATPIRPRRVGGSSLALSPEVGAEEEDDEAEDDENMFTPARGFAEFAERLGAQELPDLLEAAVAYAACVEGRPHVSRPYMLRQVGTLVADAEGKRDEMLRGFGRLLRGGRIEKVRAGLYALPGSSRVMAEARKIAV